MLTLGARSVAFPPITTGVNGFSPERAAHVAVNVIRSASTAVELVRLGAFDELTRDLLAATLST